MTRSVKDLRELICVSRLSIRDSDDDDDYDLLRPLSSLSIYGESSAGLVNGNGDFAVPRPPSSARGPSRLRSGERPQSAQSKSLSEYSSFNFRTTPLPPVGGGSRPSSSSGSSSGSDRPGSGEAPSNNFDDILQYLAEVAITEWLQRTTQMLNELTVWCQDLDHFVDFAQFWLTEFPDSQRLGIYKLEIGIIADELIAALGDAYKEGKIRPSDISRVVSAVLKEYPTKLCSVQGPHVFLDVLDTITSHQKTQEYKRLLTDTKASTRNGTCAQSLLALRAFTLVSVWTSVVNFYKTVSQEVVGAEGGVTSPHKKPLGSEDQVAQQRLFLAVRKGHVSVIYYFLRNAIVKPDVRDDKGRTLTFAAVLANQSSVLHYLITKHKDVLPVNQPGESGNTPLHTAANWNYVDCIQVLLTKGNADVNITNPQCDNATPLHVAVMQGHLEASKMLVSAGASVTASMNGITPLQLATDMGHVEISKLLQRKSGIADFSEEAMDTTDNVDNA